MALLIAIGIYAAIAATFYVVAAKTATPHQEQERTGPSPNLKVIEGGLADEEERDIHAA